MCDCMLHVTFSTESCTMNSHLTAQKTLPSFSIIVLAYDCTLDEATCINLFLVANERGVFKARLVLSESDIT